MPPHRPSFWLISAALSWVTADGQACGGFFSRRAALEDARRPSLAYEQTLIVFDEAKRREHFVREVVFRSSREPFGFVVPTPTRPDVGPIEDSPFAELRNRYELEGSGPGLLEAGARMEAERPVTVLEKKRVGSFTAFVLSATDESAFAAWLEKNGLEATPETVPWLRHYVERGFFYVAMRYEPSAGAKGKSETMRISFDTPVPYYPYFEPTRADATEEPRMLDVWLVATQRWLPVATHTEDGKARWVRPLFVGRVYEDLSPRVSSDIDPALSVQAGELLLQRFADQKRSRAGFSDIVFVPWDHELAASELDRAVELYADTLDSSLLPEAP